MFNKNIIANFQDKRTLIKQNQSKIKQTCTYTTDKCIPEGTSLEPVPTIFLEYRGDSRPVCFADAERGEEVVKAAGLRGYQVGGDGGSNCGGSGVMVAVVVMMVVLIMVVVMVVWATECRHSLQFAAKGEDLDKLWEARRGCYIAVPRGCTCVSMCVNMCVLVAWCEQGLYASL